MATVDNLTRGDTNERDPTWEQVRTCLLGLRDEQTHPVDAGKDAWLIVLRSANHGYLVTGCGIGERDYFTLIDRTLGDDPVTAFDGGDTHEYPRHAFVSESLMLRAVAAYYETGQRDQRYEWVPDGDAMY